MMSGTVGAVQNMANKNKITLPLLVLTYPSTLWEILFPWSSLIKNERNFWLRNVMGSGLLCFNLCSLIFCTIYPSMIRIAIHASMLLAIIRPDTSRGLAFWYIRKAIIENANGTRMGGTRGEINITSPVKISCASIEGRSR